MNRFITACVLLLCFALSGSAQVKLNAKFPPKSKWVTETESKTSQLLTIAGTDVETKSDSQTVTEHITSAKKADGSVELTAKAKSMQVDLSLPGGMTLSFSSFNPKAKAENAALEPLLDLYRAMMNVQVKATVKNNKVVSAKANEDALEKLADRYKKRFKSETVTKAMRQDYAFLPDEPVKVGATWDREEEMGAEGSTIVMKKRYKYLGTVKKDKKTLHKIGVTLTGIALNSDGGNAPAQLKESKLNVASSSGEILFDQELGQPVSVNTKMKVKGTIKIEVNSMELEGKIEITMESKKTRQP